MNNRNTWIAAIALSLGMLFSSVLRADDDNLNLNLTCRGSGYARKSESTNISRYDPETKKYTTATAQTNTKESFDGIAVVDISGGMGRIKLPEQMVPPLNTRSDGWFNMHDINVTPNLITGSVKINFLNSKKIRIDRRSGLMTIEGGGTSFSGQCEATDRNAPRKF
jgi:hypothetical protein